METTSVLSESSPDYIRVSREFYENWTKKENVRDLRIEAIIEISYPTDLLSQYQAYAATKSGTEQEPFFHGTHSCSMLTEDGFHIKQCNACGVCGIVKSSFSIDYVGKNKRGGPAFQRFGDGIYLTSASSKAHWYSKSGEFILKDEARSARAMIRAKVVVGNPYKPNRSCKSLNNPPQGFDSVLGEAGQAGLNYPELVVYRNDAVLATHCILYSYTWSSANG